MCPRLGTHLLAALITLLFLVFFPVLFLLVLPIYGFRWVIAKIVVPLFRPDLHKPVQSRSSVLAVDNPYKLPKWNLCAWIVVEENLDFETFKKNVYERIICRKLGNGQFADPEYQQYYRKFCGFLFWAWEENFNIHEHMRVLEASLDRKYTTETELKQLLKHLSYAPFKPEKSPWEFIYIPNYVSETDESPNPKSLFIMRVHHGFCDGSVILKLLTEDLNNVTVGTNAAPHYSHKSWWRQTLDIVAFPVKAPYQVAVATIDARNGVDVVSEWKKEGGGLEVEREKYSLGLTRRIPLKLIKDVKNSFHVSFNGVVVSILAAGMRRLMIQKGMKVPENISTGIPCPMPQRPNKLRNHFVFAFLKLPTAIKDPVQRLKKVEANLDKLKQSLIPHYHWGMIPLVGSLFYWMIGVCTRNIFTLSLISNFPGPRGGDRMDSIGYFTADGGKHWITDMNFVAGGGDGILSLGFCCLSYNSGMRIITEAASHICKNDEEAEMLNGFILEELQLLHSLTLV